LIVFSSTVVQLFPFPFPFPFSFFFRLSDCLLSEFIKRVEQLIFPAEMELKAEAIVEEILNTD
jgi:hypothetical protein